MKKALVLVATCCSFAGAGLLYTEETGSIEFLNSGKVLPANLPFSEAVRVDNLLYLSGQIGIVPGSVKLAAGGIKNLFKIFSVTKQEMQALPWNGSS